MTLQEHLPKDKLTIIAMQVLLRDCAEEASVVLAGSVSEICRQAVVNRPQVYERKAQLWAAFAELELAAPGRPVKAEPPPGGG
jgi:hypothetical protein